MTGSLWKSLQAIYSFFNFFLLFSNLYFNFFLSLSFNTWYYLVELGKKKSLELPCFKAVSYILQAVVFFLYLLDT